MPILPIDPTRYTTFLWVMGAMAMTPGPANVFAIATGAERGRLAVAAAVTGMNCATLVWFGAAALGLGALVLAFPEAFHLVAYAGAAYVSWLGFKALKLAFAPQGDLIAASPSVRRGPSAFVDGFIVQISNPKAVLFFTAILPPFLDPRRPMVPQLSAFAVTVIAFDVLAMGAYGLGGAAITRQMTEPSFRRGFQICVGLLLIGAAALMATRSHN